MLSNMIMWQPPKDQFFEVRPVVAAAQWGVPPASWVQPNNDYRTSETLKRAFGQALARLNAKSLQETFTAACEVFPDNTNAALWVTHNWLSDSVVVAARVEKQEEPPVVLDREQFAAKVLAMAEAKTIHGTSSFDDKERVNLLKLYAEVKGFIGKSDTTINNNTLVQGLRVTLVKPNVKPVVELNESAADELPELNNVSPLKLKLVK